MRKDILIRECQQLQSIWLEQDGEEKEIEDLKKDIRKQQKLLEHPLSKYTSVCLPEGTRLFLSISGIDYTSAIRICQFTSMIGIKFASCAKPEYDTGQINLIEDFYLRASFYSDYILDGIKVAGSTIGLFDMNKVILEIQPDDVKNYYGLKFLNNLKQGELPYPKDVW